MCPLRDLLENSGDIVALYTGPSAQMWSKFPTRLSSPRLLRHTDAMNHLDLEQALVGTD
jgi:hypothetical protein